MSGEDHNTEIFQTTLGVRQGRKENQSLFNLFPDFFLRIYKHSCEEMGTDYLSILCHIPNDSNNSRQQSCFHSQRQCTDDEGGYAEDIAIRSWDENVLEQKNQCPLPSVQR